MSSKRSGKTPRAASLGTDKQWPANFIADRNARQRADFTVRLEKAHEEIHAAFRDALKKTRCSQSQAALSMGVNVDTVRNWVRKRSKVRVANVFASRRLGKVFKRLLCSEDHEPVSTPAPYVARKRKAPK